MITKALFDFFGALVGFIVGLFPTSGAPGWVNDGAGYLAQIWGYADGLGGWIPWSLAGTLLSAVFACMLLSVGIKVVRIVASFLTLGGGSAS